MIELLFIIILIAVSFLLLIKGADYLVEGASDTARWLKVSPMLVGLTIVAFGTSLPELMVSLFSALNGHFDLSVGNVIGSNIFNIAFIIGLSALITPLIIKSRTVMYEFPFMVLSAFLLVITSDDHFIFLRDTFTLGRLDGIIFLGAFGLFLYYVYLSAQHDHKMNTRKKSDFKVKRSRWKNVLFTIGGLVALVVGGRLFVYAATKLAVVAGISETFIGLTIASIGTSLPELFTSAIAAWKKEMDLAVGNIVGSNIFNILFILGITSVIKPLEVSRNMIFVDGMVMIAVSLLFLFFAARYKKISRRAGIIFLVSYLMYFGWLVWGLWN